MGKWMSIKKAATTMHKWLLRLETGNHLCVILLVLELPGCGLPPDCGLPEAFFFA